MNLDATEKYLNDKLMADGVLTTNEAINRVRKDLGLRPTQDGVSYISLPQRRYWYE